MGCDIHLFVEVYRKRRWTVIGNPQQLNESENYENWLWSGRNYRLFAILADVRNYDGFEPIDYPRGLPKDVSPQIKRLAKGLAEDCHSHSWLNLKEFLDFDWDKSAGITTRYVSPEAAKLYAETGEKPTSSCLFTSDESWVSLSWELSYRQCCAGFLDEVLPELHVLGEPDQVRIVFWFDN